MPQLNELDDHSISMTGTLSSFGTVTSTQINDNDKEWDFTTQSGIKEYFEENKADSITKNRLQPGFFLFTLP